VAELMYIHVRLFIDDNTAASKVSPDKTRYFAPQTYPSLVSNRDSTDLGYDLVNHVLAKDEDPQDAEFLIDDKAYAKF
jgi:hypothetical protein